MYLNSAEAFPMASTYKLPIARIGDQQLNWLLDGYDVSRLHPHRGIRVVPLEARRVHAVKPGKLRAVKGSVSHED